MKKIFIGLQTLIFVLIFSACHEPKKTSDNQPVNSQLSSVDSTAKQPEPEKKDSSAERQRGSKRTTESLTGSQIVDKASNRLVSKLKLDAPQTKQVQDILRATFTGSGKDLNKTYTAEEGRTIGHDIIIGSTDQINAILNADQKALFTRVGHN